MLTKLFHRITIRLQNISFVTKGFKEYILVG